jgi:hypothetical protein
MRDFTCIAFEVEFDKPNYAEQNTTEQNNALLQRLLDLGEQIVYSARAENNKIRNIEKISKSGYNSATMTTN